MLYMPPKLPQQNIRGLNRLTPTLRIYATAQVQVSTSVGKKQLSVLRHLIVCSRTTPLDITLGYNNAHSLTLSSPGVKPGVGLNDPHGPFQLRICYACDHPNARFRGQILLTLMPPSTNPPCLQGLLHLHIRAASQDSFPTGITPKSTPDIDDSCDAFLESSSRAFLHA